MKKWELKKWKMTNGERKGNKGGKKKTNKVGKGRKEEKGKDVCDGKNNWEEKNCKRWHINKDAREN